MKDIHDSILKLKELVESTPNLNNEFSNGILSVMEALINKVEEVQVNVETLDENLSLINDDLSEVQDELFEEVTLEELEEYEEEYCEVTCTNCNKEIFVEKSMVTNKESIPCPYCNSSFIA